MSRVGRARLSWDLNPESTLELNWYTMVPGGTAPDQEWDAGVARRKVCYNTSHPQPGWGCVRGIRAWHVGLAGSRHLGGRDLHRNYSNDGAARGKSGSTAPLIPS